MSAVQGIGFFTLGVSPDRYDLPHPPLGLPVVLLIRRVLMRAFELLRDQRFNLAEAKEDEITDALRSTIENNLRQSGEVRGFSKRTYETVIRQGQWKNYNGACLTKTPDLFFKLRDDDGHRGAVISESDGLFIEAKPVDATHSAGGKYCDDGLIRFIRGDYAWAMQEGMMLAYARHGRTIAGNLIPAVNNTARQTALLTRRAPAALPRCASTHRVEVVHVSEHGRDFPWPDNKGPACNITIYHLWHLCD